MPPLQREALAFVVRLRSGEATNRDLADVRAWRARSAEHERAFVAAVRMWRTLQQTADALAEADAETAPRRAFGLSLPNPGRRAVIGGLVAASAGAAAWIVAAPPLDLWPSLAELRADWRTDKGERRDVVVADGVIASLNTQTSLARGAPQAEQPVLRLVSGEVVLKVTRPADSWVTVEALGARITSARGAFAARCLGDTVAVTCLNGTVDVEADRVVAPLQPGQSVSYSGAEGLGLPVAVNPDLALAWQRGLIVVRNRPLAEVVDEVNRYRRGRILVTNADLGRTLVSGTFQIDRLDTFPGQVQQLFGARVQSLPGGVILLS